MAEQRKGSSASGSSADECEHAWPSARRWLFRYIMVVAILAFCNRSLPTSFLPLILHSDFHQSFETIGIAMAAYPAAALLATGWSTRRAVGSSNVIRFHALALVLMSLATLMFGSCQELLRILGTTPSVALMVVFRCLQGLTSAMYLSANTTLITRYFAADIPYVLGMVEVGVGVGSQIGRMLGGALYDVGGFAFPFSALAVVQILWACFGLSLKEEETPDQSTGLPITVTKTNDSMLPWEALLSKRVVLASFAVFSVYFMTGTLDTTLPQHLEDNLGPIPISTISVLMSMRALSYIANSFMWTQVIRAKTCGYQTLLALGACGSVFGIMLLGPLGPLQSIAGHSETGKATLQIVALFITSGSLAAVFIPSLPLMQRDVGHLGSRASEQVAQLFIMAMSFGEAVGPILGGALVARLGFDSATLMFTIPFAIVFMVGMLLPDHTKHGNLLPTDSNSGPILNPIDEDTIMPAMFDEYCSFYRSISCMPSRPRQPPGSAPDINWRRPYLKVERTTKPWMTEPPSSSQRRSYQRLDVPNRAMGA